MQSWSLSMIEPVDEEGAVVEDPGYATVRKHLLYGFSLPERTLRSGVGLVGGAVRESTALLVPQAFQTSQTYSILVRQTLNFLVEDVGGVAAQTVPGQTARVENYVARKAVGNFIEMAGMATLHVSPLTLLAVVADVAYGSQTYLKELSAELKREGVIDADSKIDHVDDLLAAVAKASSVTAQAFDTPPLSADGLRETIEQTRAAVTAIDPVKVIPQAEMARLWDEMHEMANREHVSLLDVSTTMTLRSLDKIATVGRGALSTVRVAGTLFDRHVIDHYEEALQDIRTRGIFASLSEASEPYISAVWQNFSTERATVTEDLLSGKLVGQAWGKVRGWLGMAEQNEPAPAMPSAVEPD
jgi:hypothetical protein